MAARGSPLTCPSGESTIRNGSVRILWGTQNWAPFRAGEEVGLRRPTSVALRLTQPFDAVGGHALEVCEAWETSCRRDGDPGDSRRGAMLPLSVRLRVTSPALDYQVPDSERWADRVGRGLAWTGRAVGSVR